MSTVIRDRAEIKSGAEVLPPKPRSTREKAAELAKRTGEDRRKTRCCFTGHRLQKLTRPVDDIKVDLENEILQAIADGYRTFITGMARGTDIWAGKIVIRLKDRFPDIRLIAAIPFPSFYEGWDAAWREKYEKLLSAADLVKIISEEYRDNVYQQRNEWMVDHSSRVIAVYDGSAGGTRNTIRYARSSGVSVKCLRG